MGRKDTKLLQLKTEIKDLRDQNQKLIAKNEELISHDDKAFMWHQREIYNLNIEKTKLKAENENLKT